MKKEKNLFIILWVLFLLITGALLLFIEKGDAVLWWNERRHILLNNYFAYTTWLGDGIMLVPFVIILLLFVSYYRAINLAFISIFILLFSQGLKRTLFSGWPRPTAYFPEGTEWNFVEGVKVATSNTFPSGHTTAAFAMFFFASIMVKNPIWRVILFIAALSAGLSRIYLLQHFLIDVFFGSILGVMAVYVGTALTEKIFPTSRYPFLRERNILTLLQSGKGND